MGEKIIEVIPCISFRERLKITKQVISKGFKVEHIGKNVLLVDYTTSGVV